MSKLTYLISRRMLKQPITHHNVVAAWDQRQSVQIFGRIRLEPPDLAFATNLLFGFDTESEHGGRNVEDVHELCAHIDGLSCILAVAATEVENCQSRAVAQGLRYEFCLELCEGEVVVGGVAVGDGLVLGFGSGRHAVKKSI
jgi:uncharacterized protein YceH (UPF0502 family)